MARPRPHPTPPRNKKPASNHDFTNGRPRPPSTRQQNPRSQGKAPKAEPNNLEVKPKGTETKLRHSPQLVTGPVWPPTACNTKFKKGRSTSKPRKQIESFIHTQLQLDTVMPLPTLTQSTVTRSRDKPQTHHSLLAILSAQNAGFCLPMMSEGATSSCLDN